MPPFYGPPWGPAGRRRPTVNPNLRVSDAERAEVADRLSRHYGEGRLDQAEFNERMERAMSAKTQGDLSGLLDDLPPDENPAETAPRQRHPAARVLFLILVIVLAGMIWHGLAHALWFPFFFFAPIPWLLIGLLVFLWLRHGPRGHRGGPGTR